MSHWNPSATVSNGIGNPYLTAQFSDKPKEENKVNNVALKALNSTENNQVQQLNLGNLSLNEFSFNRDIKNLSDEKLNALLRDLQSEQQRRARFELSNQQETAKMNECRKELLKYLTLNNWEKFNSEIEKFKGNFSSSAVDDMLNSLEEEVLNAVKKIGYYEYNPRELDAIYEAFKNSPILIGVIEIVMKKSEKQMYHLLEKDKTIGNGFVVAARSKAISYFIEKNLDLFRLLQGPFSFLFDDDTVINYLGYDKDRSKFIEYLNKCTLKQFFDILYISPKNKSLPKDAFEIFKNSAIHDQKKWALQAFLEKTPDSTDKAKLLALINPVTAA